jgi:hypothetical protein
MSVAMLVVLIARCDGVIQTVPDWADWRVGVYSSLLSSSSWAGGLGVVKWRSPAVDIAHEAGSSTEGAGPSGNFEMQRIPRLDRSTNPCKQDFEFRKVAIYRGSLAI